MRGPPSTDFPFERPTVSFVGVVCDGDSIETDHLPRLLGANACARADPRAAGDLGARLGDQAQQHEPGHLHSLRIDVREGYAETQYQGRFDDPLC